MNTICRIAHAPEYIIRPGVAADAECLAALTIQVWLHTYATYGIRNAIARHVLSEFAPAKFSRMLHEPGLLFLIAESNHNLLGYALLRFDAIGPTETRANVELATLYVQEHFAKRGLGTALIAECQRRVDGYPKADRLWLTANSKNEGALAFYRKLNFEHAGFALFEFGGEQHQNHVFVSPRGSPPIASIGANPPAR
jgi:ribosomal protein S18 acetylase RimI-like enzyme